MKLPALKALLDYRNDTVLCAFCVEQDYSQTKGQQVFTDLLAWLWLNAYRQIYHQKMTYLFGPLLLLDKMWHTFILHTQDYYGFCLQYFKEYFHHHVEPVGHEYVLSPDELATFLHDAFEHLGEQWVHRQFGPLYGTSPTHANVEDSVSSV